IEQAAHPIFLADAEGRITACNRAAVTLLDAGAERAVGSDFAETVLTADGRATCRNALARLLEQDGEASAPAPLRLVAQSRGAASLPVEVMMSVLTLGGRRAVVIELHDISERVTAEAELSRVWRLLRDAVDNI